MNNIYVIIAKDANVNPIYLEKICFKPMIEYCIETLIDISNRKPIIMTDSPGKLSCYNNVAEVVKDINGFKAECNVVVVNAASPLITIDVIKNSIEYFNSNKCNAVKVGNGLFVFSFNDFIKFKDTFNFNDVAEDISVHIKGFADTIVCENKIDISLTNRKMRLRINERLMNNGVVIIDPENTYIQKDVSVGENSVIYPNTIIEGKTTIGNNCEIYSGCHIIDTIIGNNVTVRYSVIISSNVGDFTIIGPFAYIRPESNIASNVKIGDFVEIKKATVGQGTKISHLTYIGDAIIGKNVNIGCGAITVNYDGKNKFLTEICDDSFIGCNANLVAPVKVGNNSFIAAGSTITKDVPDKSMAIARSHQVNKNNWIQPKDRDL